MFFNKHQAAFSKSFALVSSSNLIVPSTNLSKCRGMVARKFSSSKAHLVNKNCLHEVLKLNHSASRLSSVPRPTNCLQFSDYVPHNWEKLAKQGK